jgi:hypothetical protein
MMETTSTGGQVCPTCGAATSATTPAGQCTRCLIQLALREGSFGQSATPAPKPTPAKYFGDYELVREIARGGALAVRFAECLRCHSSFWTSRLRKEHELGIVHLGKQENQMLVTGV